MINSINKALVLSFLLHVTLFWGICSLSGTLERTACKPVVIDLALLDTSAAASESTETGIERAPMPEPERKNGHRDKAGAYRIERAEPARTAPVNSPQPALEAAGPVPASSRTVEAPPEKTSAAATGEGGNQATATATGTASPGASGAGGGNSGEQARRRYTREHYAYIKDLIEKNLSYPPRARKMGWSGRVVVCFQVLKNGRVDKIRVKNSSGYEILDRNVIDTIREVEPFPRPPEWVEVSMPINYRLN